MEDKNYLIIDDTKYETQISNKFRNRKNYVDPDPKRITAFIPGTVFKIMVQQGDMVNLGTKLLILEAMKMKNTISSPMSGKIKKINVKTGEKVPKGHLLIEFE